MVPVPDMHKDAGLQLIIAWKLLKAVLLGASGLFLLTSHGGRLGAVVDWLSQTIHVAPEVLAERLSQRNLTALGVALCAVAVIDLVEAVGLHLRRRWGAWLTILATSSLIPVEIYRITRAPHLARVLTLLVNLLIVWYLARRLKQHPSTAPTQVPPPGSAPSERRAEI